MWVERRRRGSNFATVRRKGGRLEYTEEVGLGGSELGGLRPGD